MNKFPAPIRKVRFFSPRQEIDRLLFLSALFSLALVLIRIVHTRQITFLSLPWNLFLAWLPYFISGLIRTYHLDWRRGWIFWSMFLLWVLFIPNSFYILTDLFH